jgi:hypothetical protein
MTQDVKVAKAIYVLSDGTAAGDISLAETTSIPAGAIIVGVSSNEVSAVGGADNVDIKVGSQVICTDIDLTGADSGVSTGPGTLVPLVITTAADIQLDNEGSTLTGASAEWEIFVHYLLG